MSEGLKPCPFCGSEPLSGAILDHGYVKCANVECLFMPTITFRDEGNTSGFTQARKAWNARASDHLAETNRKLVVIIEREIDVAKRLEAGAVTSVYDELREWFGRKANRLTKALAAAKEQTP